MAKVLFTNKAVEDLTAIWKYTAINWSRTQADRYYNMLIDACRGIMSDRSVASRSYESIAYGLSGLRAGRHIVFYRIQADGDILVIRILHERMDLKKHLAK